MPIKTLRKPSDGLINILSDNIVRLRRLQGISQEELATRAGLHRTYIGSVERGERNITLSSLEMLASALGVSVTTLLTKVDRDAESES